MGYIGKGRDSKRDTDKKTASSREPYACEPSRYHGMTAFLQDPSE